MVLTAVWGWGLVQTKWESPTASPAGGGNVHCGCVEEVDT